MSIISRKNLEAEDTELST